MAEHDRHQLVLSSTDKHLSRNEDCLLGVTGAVGIDSLHHATGYIHLVVCLLQHGADQLLLSRFTLSNIPPNLTVSYGKARGREHISWSLRGILEVLHL